MIQLTPRQKAIVDYVGKTGLVSAQAVRESLAPFFQHASKVTVLRDLNFLIERKIIQKQGRRRSARYELSEKNEALRYIDPESYFSVPPDERKIMERFNFEIFNKLHNVFSPEETARFGELAKDYRKRLKKLTPQVLKREFERLTIEFSWKSSRIEGNTYSLIDTEILIKDEKEAAGHKKEEAVMILNQKSALEYIRDERSDFKQLSSRSIEDVHGLVVQGLGIKQGIRKGPVGIVGTRYKPLDNEYQLKEAIEKACALVNEEKSPLAKALLSVALISYIQPFEDGNKRTSRLMGNALLIAHNYPPLSFRSVDEAEYKKAMVLFYEQNSIRYFKELFVEQFIFSADNYFIG